MKIKGMKIKTVGVIAEIRKCKGLVIETLTTQPERKEILNVVMEFMEDPEYNVYGLRHSENDWSKPMTISKTPVLVNRFGWFITKDEMIFNKTDEVEINRRNSMYFESIFYDPNIVLCPGDIFECAPITVSKYVNDQDRINDAILALPDLSQKFWIPNYHMTESMLVPMSFILHYKYKVVNGIEIPKFTCKEDCDAYIEDKILDNANVNEES